MTVNEVSPVTSFVASSPPQPGHESGILGWSMLENVVCSLNIHIDFLYTLKRVLIKQKSFHTWFITGQRMDDKNEDIERDELILKGIAGFSGAGVFIYLVDPNVMQSLLQPLVGAVGVTLVMFLLLFFGYHRVYLDSE